MLATGGELSCGGNAARLAELERLIGAENLSPEDRVRAMGGCGFGGGLGMAGIAAPGGSSAATIPATKCLHLNEAASSFDELVNSGNDASLDLQYTDSFSMGCWIKVNGYGSYMGILSKTDGTGKGWTLYMNGGKVVISFNNDGWYYYDDTRNVADNAWHLVGASYASASQEVYIDGTAAVSTTSGGSRADISNTGDLIVGAKQNGTSNWYFGKVCHPFLVDKEMTAADWTEAYATTKPIALDLSSFAGNLLWWAACGDGDAIGANNVIDLSGNGNPGTTANVVAGDFETDAP